MTEPGNPLDRRIEAALRERFQPPAGLAVRLERTLRPAQRRPQRFALAWVLVAAAVVAAAVLLLRSDLRPVLEAKLLHERVSHWSDLTGCSIKGVPLPQPLPGPKLALDPPGGSIYGPYAVPEWPGAALFRVEVPATDPAAAKPAAVHALLVVALADAARFRIEVQEPWTATMQLLGELQVFDFHRQGTPAVAGRLSRVPD